MAITLLGKYEAYAPPFKFEIEGREARIGGVVGLPQWEDDLGNQLRMEWDRLQRTAVTKEWKLPSAHEKDLFYTVRKINDGFSCTCPARGRCWHIKVAKELDFADCCDELDFTKRVNDYDNPL